MDDNTFSNITQILTSFDSFVSILEDPLWVKSAKAEHIKDAFKLGLFLEKASTYITTHNICIEFFKVLNRWWNSHHRMKVYSKHFFLFSCDQLLVRFFRTEHIAEMSLEIAVRVYTSMFPKERLKVVLSKVILMSSSQEAITDFANFNLTDLEKTDLEYCLVLNNWSNLLQSAKENDIQVEIENRLSSYKVEQSLSFLIGMLSVNSSSEFEKQIQLMLLQNLMQKMLDRSLLSKSFWLTMFKKVELQSICKTCRNFHQFFVSIFNFVAYLCGMMKKVDGEWQSNESVSVCPEINYQEILIFIKTIYNINNSFKDIVLQKLLEAQEYTDSSIWEEIKLELL